MKRIIQLLFATMLLASCNRHSMPTKVFQTGEASYYSDKFDGQPTASGETYRANQLTAAHRTLPFGTKVTVTNLANGKTVVVRINDRGPHKPSRIIDLSKTAAIALDMLRSGVAQVNIAISK